MPKLKIGDIAEIKTPEGLAYVQHTHNGKNMGELVRVLPGLYPSRPQDLSLLTHEREKYFIFYALRHALRAGLTEIVSSQPVPEWARSEPVMRHAAGRAPDGRVNGWRIVPALHPLTLDFLQRTPVLRHLTPEQRALSIRQLWPHAVLVEELARQWTPERAEEFEEQDREHARTQLGKRPAVQISELRHFLYFSRKQDAESAAEHLQGQGFCVEVSKSRDGESWLALATKVHPKSKEEMDELRDELEGLARQFGGEYDGWEAALDALSSTGTKPPQRLN